MIFVKGLTLGKEIKQMDMRKLVPKLEIPAYFLSGQYDYITNHELVRQFEEQLDAPVKGYYVFKESAHSPIFEEPEAFIEVLTKEIKKEQ